MKTPRETAIRLLTALEDFVAREGVLLRSGDYAQAVAIQQRVNPLVAKLCLLGKEPGVAGLGPRVMAVVARRREFLSGLAMRRESLGAERRRLTSMRQRLQRLRPYVRTAPAARQMGRLNAAV
jgi:hypothetical protein